MKKYVNTYGLSEAVINQIKHTLSVGYEIDGNRQVTFGQAFREVWKRVESEKVFWTISTILVSLFLGGLALTFSSYQHLEPWVREPLFTKRFASLASYLGRNWLPLLGFISGAGFSCFLADCVIKRSRISEVVGDLKRKIEGTRKWYKMYECCEKRVMEFLIELLQEVPTAELVFSQKNEIDRIFDLLPYVNDKLRRMAGQIEVRNLAMRSDSRLGNEGLKEMREKFRNIVFDLYRFALTEQEKWDWKKLPIITDEDRARFRLPATVALIEYEI